MTDAQMIEIRDLIDRVARVLSGDIVWEDPADVERMRQKAKRVLLEIRKSHVLLKLSGEAA